MAVKYAIRKKKFKDADNETQELYFATAHRTDIVKTDEIAKLIQEATSLNEADIYGALKALSQVIANQLKAGKSVKLDGIGVLSLSITSKPSSTAANVPHKSVKINKVCFKADRKLSEKVKEAEIRKLEQL